MIFIQFSLKSCHLFLKHFFLFFQILFHQYNFLALLSKYNQFSNKFYKIFSFMANLLNGVCLLFHYSFYNILVMGKDHYILGSHFKYRLVRKIWDHFDKLIFYCFNLISLFNLRFIMKQIF